MQRLSIGRALGFALLGVAVTLAAIAALGIASLYDARQRYEDRLAATYELEATTARLLAAGVIEEVVLGQRSASPEQQATAREVFDRLAAEATGLAAGDADSEHLVQARVEAQERARAAAAAGPVGDPGDEFDSAIATGRRLSTEVTERQRARRADARDRAEQDSDRATLTAAVAGVLALLAALAFAARLIRSMRRPLDDLLGATRRLAAGKDEERIDPHGPRELRELGRSFNTMAGELETARRRIEDERLKLAVTIESLGDALAVCASDGSVTQLNPRAHELLPELRLGEAPRPGGPLPALEQALAGEVVLERSGRTLSVTAARLGEDQGGGVVWTARDVTERARLERLKSEFVTTASHELRSPLTSIKGFAELLARSDDLSPALREFADVILVSTDRLVDLVNDLLDVARAEAGKIEIERRPTEIALIAREVAELMGPRLDEKRHELELDLPDDVARADADPARVRQMLTNLVTNAHLYTPEGGRIGIRLRDDRGGVAIEVWDTGVGMTAEEAERVFDRFYRSGEGRFEAPGSGLGLSIVRSLVELHGGEVEVESTPGEGSTFRLRLPAVQAPANAATGEPASRG